MSERISGTPPRSRLIRLPDVPLSWLLLALVLVVLVPAACVGVLATWNAATEGRLAAEGRMRDTARALALAIGSEIDTLRSAMLALSGAAELDGPEPDLATFEREARRAATFIDTSVSLLEAATLRQVFNTALPPGQQPPPTTAASFRQVVETARPMVTNLVIGAVARQPVVGVAVPVIREGQVRFVLSARLTPERLRRLLAAQGLVERSFAAVVDGSQRLVARSDALHDRLLAQPIPPENARHFAGREAGMYRGTALDGVERVFAFHALPSVPGWTSILATEAAAFDAAWTGPMRTQMLGATLVFAFGIGAALLLARAILVPVALLGRDARALASGTAPRGDQGPSGRDTRLSIAELRVVRQGFASAGTALAERDEARTANALILARQAERRLLLLDLSRAILEKRHDEEALAEMVFQRAALVLGADLLFNFALEEDGRTLRLVAAPGLPPGQLGAIARLSIGDGFCGNVAATRRPIQADAGRIGCDPAGVFLRALGATAYVGHPLLAQDGRLLGTLAFASTRRDRFGDEDLDLLETLARLVALAWQQRQAELALRESEAFGRSILCSTSDCMAVLDVNGYLAFLNEPGRCQKELDSVSSVLGKHVTELWPEEARPLVEAAVDEARAGRTAHYTAFGPTAKGTPKWWDVTVTPVPGAEGEPPRLLSVARDITERKATEAALARHTDDLERLVGQRTSELRESEARLAQAAKMEALGRLAGGVAHDFNNVLQSVQGGIALARKRLNCSLEDAERFLDLANDAAARGASVTGRLLSFARRGELQVAPVQAAPMLDGLAEMLRATLGPSVLLRVEATTGLPDLLADAGQLEAVLVNLANNSRDALPNGAGTITLAASQGLPVPSHLPPGDYVRVSVIDDGEGMTPEVLARVTEPFFTTKPKGKGTGLGLAMARGFAEQSGGTLTIESAPGRGTTVSLWLRQATDRAGTGSIAEPAAALHGAPALERASLLVVDDEPGVRMVLATALSEFGHCVEEAEDGASALRRLDQGTPVCALVTDLAMPGGMDGLALIREARRRRPGLPAILVTGHLGDATHRALEEAAGSGPFALLRKPVAPAAVEAQIAVLLEGERNRRRYG